MNIYPYGTRLTIFKIWKYKIKIVNNLENLKLNQKWSKVDIARGREPTPAAYRGAYQTTTNNLKSSRTGQYIKNSINCTNAE